MAVQQCSYLEGIASSAEKLLSHRTPAHGYRERASSPSQNFEETLNDRGHRDGHLKHVEPSVSSTPVCHRRLREQAHQPRFSQGETSDVRRRAIHSLIVARRLSCSRLRRYCKCFCQRCTENHEQRAQRLTSNQTELPSPETAEQR